jgi:hypothetical protein
MTHNNTTDSNEYQSGYALGKAGAMICAITLETLCHTKRANFEAGWTDGITEKMERDHHKHFLKKTGQGLTTA